MRKKVLHVINSLTIGGAETLLANSLSPGGLQEHTDNFLVYFNTGSHLLDIIDKDVHVINLDYTGGFDIFRMLRELRSVIKDNKIDIVHSHLTPASIYTHLACPANIPQVHTIHSTYSMETETRHLLQYIERKIYLLKKNCNVICLSAFTREDLLRSLSFKGNAFVLNNFVADSFFENQVIAKDTDKSKFRLLAVGTLKELKNFEYLLQVFEYLAGKEIYLDIYGDGDRLPYENIIKAKKLNVRMMGRADDMAKVYCMYDLFIMPSRYEGFPLSLFEAMASGVPLMLSDIAPLKSIVKDNAVYFGLEDAVATAAKIAAIAENRTGINEMAAKARIYAGGTVKREIYIEQLLKIYDILTAKASK